jgi:hypothetical protein
VSVWRLQLGRYIIQFTAYSRDGGNDDGGGGDDDYDDA